MSKHVEHSALMRRVLLLVALLAAVLVLLPGTAQASTYEGQSHMGVAVSTTVIRGDTAWGIAARLCGRGSLHTALTFRSAVGVPRPNHDRIWPGDKVTGSCTAARRAPVVASRSTTRSSTGWVSPLVSYRLTSCFGWREWSQSYHQGLDMSAPMGAPIRAAASGTVTRTGWIWGGYGISTVISHGGGVWSHYAHQSRTQVRVGQRVAAGQVIGRVGSTGHSTGPHLHFEIARSAGVLGSQTNPAIWLRNHGIRIGC